MNKGVLSIIALLARLFYYCMAMVVNAIVKDEKNLHIVDKFVKGIIGDIEHKRDMAKIV